MQGVFGASLVPLSQSVMYELYPAEQRAEAMGLWTMGVMIGPICGPILGGWLTDNYSWRWVFYINVPFGVVTALGLLTFLKESPRSDSVRLDWIGFGALSLAIGSLQMMLDRGETLDWFNSREIILEALVAGIAFYVFLVQFFLAPRPFLSPKLFVDRNFRRRDSLCDHGSDHVRVAGAAGTLSADADELSRCTCGDRASAALPTA